MAFDPQRAGWPCRATGSCDGRWFRLGDALVCQCRYSRCRRVLAVVTSTPPFGFPAGALDALQSTGMPPADDWPGCRD